jgi:hypothetical protein
VMVTKVPPYGFKSELGVTPEITRGMSTGVNEASNGMIPFASTTTGSQPFPATAWIVQVIVVRSAET